MEDIKQNLSVKKFQINGQNSDNEDDILTALYDFYSHLYMASEQKSPEEIQTFLSSLDLPKTQSDIESLLGPIMYKEIESAIKKLHLGKSPGSDGIMAELYKHFAELISLVLESVFNNIFEQKTLSFSQRVAIIILLFKKGDAELLPNY